MGSADCVVSFRTCRGRSCPRRRGIYYLMEAGRARLRSRPIRKKVWNCATLPGFRRIIFEKSAARTKIGDQLAAYVEVGSCDSCLGTRWSFQARALRVGGRGIADILSMTFAEVDATTAVDGEFVSSVPNRARRLTDAILGHARSIISVGLAYLTGDRGMLDVSEGESRRIRLARVLDAGREVFVFCSTSQPAVCMSPNCPG